MKQFLSSKLCDVKQFLSSIFSKVRPFMVSTLRKVKQLLSSNFRSTKEHLNPSLYIPIALLFVLIIALIIGLAKCSGGQEAVAETFSGIVTVDSLDVHKKPKESSRVLGQLSLDSSVEVIELKTVGKAEWGRIEEIALDDGKLIKNGWINMQHISSADEFLEEPDLTLPDDDPTPEIKPVAVTMGTITAHKLNIRKGPASTYETNGAYYMGDRVEIWETQRTDDTEWGRTNLGWIGMGYVRMDGSEYQNEKIPENANFVTNGETTVLGYGVVNLKELNVRLGPGTEYGKIGTVGLKTRYAYYEVSNTSGMWVRIEDGWVSTEHFYLEGTTVDDVLTGTVTVDDLNIRTGPDTSFQSVNTYHQGQTIEILAQVDRWGYTEEGWVFMSYVEPVKPTYPTGSGTVNNGLNIRQEPNADAEIVGTYTTGDRVTIIEVMDNWGKTDIGWINLKYITYD